MINASLPGTSHCFVGLFARLFITAERWTWGRTHSRQRLPPSCSQPGTPLQKQKFSFWIWIWFADPQLPTSCYVLMQGYRFLGHLNLAFLEAILFVVSGRHHYSLWQETKSWQEPYNNCPFGFIFFNSPASFQIILSYRASVFCKRLKVREMHAASVLSRSAAEAGTRGPSSAHSGQKPAPTVHPRTSRSRRQSLCVLETYIVSDSFRLFEGVEEPRVPLHPGAGSTEGLSNRSWISCLILVAWIDKH